MGLELLGQIPIEPRRECGDEGEPIGSVPLTAPVRRSS